MHLRKNKTFSPAWAALFLLAAGCGGAESLNQGYLGPVQFSHRYQGSTPIPAVATTGMVADLVKNIGGSHVSVQQIMGEGVDPHLYKASPGDVNMLSSAMIIFYNGRNLEGKMGEVFARMAKQKPTVPVGQHIADQFILQEEEGHYDPHLWFDVSLWSKAAGVVRDALVLYDPAHAADYQKNADAYQAKLATLHEWVKTEIASIPKEQRVLVTAHDAFRYFGRAYDIEVRGIQGISTEDEASVKAINDLVQFLANRKIKAVFVESSVSEKNLKALIEGCEKGRGHKVAIGGELFSDAMGKPGTPEGTYEGMIRHNVTTIVKALK
jgi:manganese/zinc/iron transport system substrate-binding protein